MTKTSTIAIFLAALPLPLAAGSRKPANAPPRVLAETNATDGLFMGMSHLFTIPDYWDYGNFRPRQCAELPGKLFRARAGGAGCPEAFLESGNHRFHPGLGEYLLAQGTLHAAWRVKAPGQPVPGGRFSHVRPSSGPWQIWLEKADMGAPVWHIECQRSGRPVHHTVRCEPLPDGWYELRLALSPRALALEVNRKPAGRYSHDAYGGRFRMRFGSAQPAAGGPQVVSEYRYVFFDRFPYPYSMAESMPEGPEDAHPHDRIVRNLPGEATPQSPRHSEGDAIELKDGSVLLIWSDYFRGVAHDSSPARLSARTTRDGGRTWSRPWVVVDYDPHSPGGNVMSVSLARAASGDLLMACFEQTRGMPAKGMVLRRSRDEGKSWSGPVPITPLNGNVHTANNDCFRRLRDDRMVLACREMLAGIRTPYALYSDDDGHTWKAGRHVPPPDLTPYQVKAQNINEPSLAQCPDGRLLMVMRSVAGGHFFSYSADRGESWTKPFLSPLRGMVAPPYLTAMPGSGDLLAIWTRGMSSRTPLLSAVSKDCGKTWSPVKLLEQSEHFGYGYTSVDFAAGRALITTMRYPLFSSLERFQVEPLHHELLFLSVPVEWFYRMPR